MFRERGGRYGRYRGGQRVINGVKENVKCIK